MSFLEDAATQWDLPVATKQVISQNDRNYHRPSELRNSSTVPMDISMADTPAPNQDNKIKIVQLLIKNNSPLGVSYKGPTDGKMNSELKTSLTLLESKAKERFKDKNFSFLKGDSINAYQVVKFFEEYNKSKKLSDSKITTSKDIEDFEKLFNLPVTGILNDKLKTNIKAAEELINSVIKLPIPVKIFENNTIKYTASDVAGALKKINEFKKSNSDQKSK